MLTKSCNEGQKQGNHPTWVDIGPIATNVLRADGLGEERRDPETRLSRTRESPEENVERLGARIGVLAIAVCVVVFIIGLLIGTKEPRFCVHFQHSLQKVACIALLPWPSLHGGSVCTCPLFPLPMSEASVE